MQQKYLISYPDTTDEPSHEWVDQAHQRIRRMATLDRRLVSCHSRRCCQMTAHSAAAGVPGLSLLAALAPGLLVAHGLSGMDGFGAGSIAVAGAAAGASGLTYLLIQWLRGSPELRSLLGRLGHGRASSAGARRPGGDAAASGAGGMG